MARPPQPGAGRLRVVVLNRRALISFVLLLLVVWLITSNPFWRWMYPIGYQATIQTASRYTNVDPLLIASVIRVESKFHRTDVSHAGAVGLMQLMPDTARWIAQKMDNEPGAAGPVKHEVALVAAGQEALLARPDVNIQLGSWYIQYLTKRFAGNEVAAVAAYNAGPKRVEDWLRQKVWNGELASITDIPVGETRHFVDRVFYNYALYKRIYGNDPAWQRQPR
ncbi:MAG: lytic transglycosylase domain-containing protein [Alicyclobacillus sp.]|nr:lytic transglycosylase domain-containing protein [Alicyclobacillus sp.]